MIILDILHSVLGLPTECIHQNIVRPCKLSFSCWLQGGKHVQGCGNNKWLFSCCVSENDGYKQSHKIKKLTSFPKRTILRRRDDNEVLQQVCIFFLIKFLLTSN